MKRLTFTVSAIDRMGEIFDYTRDRYGARQAVAYNELLVSRCKGLCDGLATGQPCRAVFSGRIQADLRLARAGRHFIIYVESPEEIRVIDVVHQSANVARRLKGLP